MSDVLDVSTPAGDLPVHRWLPPAGEGPGILLLQEIFGVSRYIADRAADLAAAGYVVHAPRLYWRLRVTAVDEDDPDMLARGMGLMRQLPWPDAVADACAALSALRAAPEVAGKVGVVGFCYGGGLAFAVAAQERVDALVSFYGSALPNLLELAPRVTAPCQHHWGTADDFIPLEVVERVREAVSRADAEVEFHLYEGAGHAFDNPNALFHHAEASAQAWTRTLDFLRRHLGPFVP